MISCIIRTLNEGAFIGELLDTLRNQNILTDMLEIIVVDSGSTDNTIEIVKSHNTKLVQIKKEDFNFSYALNLGIEQSTGDFLVILSGHAIPCDNFWLAKMLAHFDDQSVAGVYCKQIPWPDADPYEALRLEKMFASDSMIYDREIPSAKLHFSNAACCIRRSAWQQHPFVVMPAAEDVEWAQWVVTQGYEIVYDSSLCVYHSHSEPCRKAAQRIIQIEKAADLRAQRKRNIILTFKQSFGWFVRDLKKIPLFSQSGYKKFTLIKDCAARSFWYAYDFNRKKQ
jgi:rhamnosyltransferase